MDPLLAALNSANGFFLLNAAKFALGDKPSFATHRAEDAALRHFLAEAFKQLILGLA
jgi:hypothetical protein